MNNIKSETPTPSEVVNPETSLDNCPFCGKGSGQKGFVPTKDLWIFGGQIPSCEVIPSGAMVEWSLIAKAFQRIHNARVKGVESALNTKPSDDVLQPKEEVDHRVQGSGQKEEDSARRSTPTPQTNAVSEESGHGYSIRNESQPNEGTFLDDPVKRKLFEQRLLEIGYGMKELYRELDECTKLTGDDYRIVINTKSYASPGGIYTEGEPGSETGTVASPSVSLSKEEEA